MSRGSIHISSDERELFFMFADYSYDYLANMNADFDVQIFVFLYSPFEKFRFIEHLLPHAD